MREEIDEVVGNKSAIDQSDLSRLEYTSAVFNESMRKWPPVPSFSRVSAQDCDILGFKIPKNSWFIVKN